MERRVSSLRFLPNTFVRDNLTEKCLCVSLVDDSARDWIALKHAKFARLAVLQHQAKPRWAYMVVRRKLGVSSVSARRMFSLMFWGALPRNLRTI